MDKMEEEKEANCFLEEKSPSIKLLLTLCLKLILFSVSLDLVNLFLGLLIFVLSVKTCPNFVVSACVVRFF